MIDFKMETARLQEKMGMTQKQTNKVVAVTLTQAAYNVQKALQDRMRAAFKGPTPFVLNSVFVRQAKVQGNTVTPSEVGIKGSVGGKVSPAHTLFAEVGGGTRRNKASESLLHGIAPDGRPQWAPGAGAELDAYGNIKGGTVKQILSAMQANRDQGVTSNSRVRGVSGLNRKQAEEIIKARREDEYAKLKRFKDASQQVRETMRIQAKSRLSDFARRLKNDESRYSEARSRIKTWLLAPGKGKTTKAIIYSFDWIQKFSKRLGRAVYKKANLKPVMVFTKPQTYAVKLPFANIAREVVTRDIRKIWDDTTMRLFTKWNSK